MTEELKQQARERIGRRIASIRKQKNMTQTELGELCELKQSHIARIEAGRYSFGLDTLEAIAQALGGTVDIIV